MVRNEVINLLISLVIFLGILGIFAVINIDRGGFKTKEIVQMALLIGLASAGRVVLDYTVHIHALKPTSFIIMVSGIVFGGWAGFIVGSLTGLVSNIFISIGPYTPWQMALWGLMGLSASLVKGKNRVVQAMFGFVWGFLFGWVMNLQAFTMGIMPFSWSSYIIYCMSSFYFDLTHALINATLFLAFSNHWLERLASSQSLYK